MTVNITIELPPDLESVIRQSSPDLAADIKEAYAIDLFRRGVLDHFSLSQFLNLDRYETDVCLIKHNVEEGGLSLEDVEQDVRNIQELLDQKK